MKYFLSLIILSGFPAFFAMKKTFLNNKIKGGITKL